MAFDFENQVCGEVLADRFPILVPQVAALPHGAGPPSLGRRHEVFSVGNPNHRGLVRRVTERLDPGVFLRSGDSLFGARETASSSEDQRRRKHIGEATPEPQRRSTGSLFRRGTWPDNCCWPTPSTHHKNCAELLVRFASSTSIHSAGTMPLVQKQGLVFFSDIARWSRCWYLQMLSCGMALVAGKRPDLVQRIVADRSAPDAAVVELDVGGALPRGPSATKRP